MAPTFDETTLAGVIRIEPDIYADARGYFKETYQRNQYTEAGIDAVFVQDNHSHSVRGVLRGLHYQLHHPQAKLVQVISGEIFDVAVDIRARIIHLRSMGGRRAVRQQGQPVVHTGRFRPWVLCAQRDGRRTVQVHGLLYTRR